MSQDLRLQQVHGQMVRLGVVKGSADLGSRSLRPWDPMCTMWCMCAAVQVSDGWDDIISTFTNASACCPKLIPGLTRPSLALCSAAATLLSPQFFTYSNVLLSP